MITGKLSDPLHNWLIEFNLVDNEDWFSEYIAAVYFSVITMITVGYGDIHATNKVERIFVIIMTLISCCVFAFSMNEIK